MRDSFLLLSVLAALASARPQSIVTGPTLTATAVPEITLVIPCFPGEEDCVARTITVEERDAEETSSSFLIPAFPTLPSWAIGSDSVSVNFGGGTTQTATILPRDPELQDSRTVNEWPPPPSTSTTDETVTVTVTDTVTPSSSKKSKTKGTTTESLTSESSNTLSEWTSGDISRSATTYFKRQSLGSVSRSASIPPTEPTTTTKKHHHSSSSSSTTSTLKSKHHTHEARQALGSPSRSVWEWPWPIITITDIVTVTDILTELPSVGRSVNTDGGSTQTATIDSASPDSVLTARQNLGSPSRSVLESPSPIPTTETVTVTVTTSSYVWTEWPWGPITPPIIAQPLTAREADPEPQSLVGSPSRTVNEWPPPPPTPTTIIETVTITDTVTPSSSSTHSPWWPPSWSIKSNVPRVPVLTAREADPEPQSLVGSPSRTVNEWPPPPPSPTLIIETVTVTDTLSSASSFTKSWGGTLPGDFSTTGPYTVTETITDTVTPSSSVTKPHIWTNLPSELTARNAEPEPQTLVSSPSRTVDEWPGPWVTLTSIPVGPIPTVSDILPWASIVSATLTSIPIGPAPTVSAILPREPQSLVGSPSRSVWEWPWPSPSTSIEVVTVTVTVTPTSTSTDESSTSYSHSSGWLTTTTLSSLLSSSPTTILNISSLSTTFSSPFPTTTSILVDTSDYYTTRTPTPTTGPTSALPTTLTVPDLPVIVPINERDDMNEKEKRQFSIWPGSVSVWAASTGSPGVIIWDEEEPTSTAAPASALPTAVPDLPVIVPINERDESRDINEEEKRQFSIWPGSVSIWAASTGSPGVIVWDEDEKEKEKRQFSIWPATESLWAASTGTGSPSVIILTERAPMAQEIVGTATRSFTFDGSSPTTTTTTTPTPTAGVRTVSWYG